VLPPIAWLVLLVKHATLGEWQLLLKQTLCAQPVIIVPLRLRKSPAMLATTVPLVLPHRLSARTVTGQQLLPALLVINAQRATIVVLELVFQTKLCLALRECTVLKKLTEQEKIVQRAPTCPTPVQQ
jgi:hypothetical protein